MEARTALLCILVAIPGTVAGQSDAQGAARLAALIARYDSAWNRRDTATVARLLAPPYQYFSSAGGVQGRDSTLRFLADSRYVLARATRSDLAVTLSGPVAVVSSRWRGEGTWRGEPFSDDQRCGMVWQRTAGDWKLLHEHCAQIVRPEQVSPD